MTTTPAVDEPNALPPGTRFGELEITCTLGAGGFGIVYLARDHSLERDVAIKEYMPSQFARRDGQSHVSVRSQSMSETFEVGRRSFVNEARLLARFDHPSLLKVYRFWEGNGTAYMAMPYLQGLNLREAARKQPTPPPEAWLRAVLEPVLDGLAVLHSQNVWHRDVAPDNIFLPDDGSPPILLDLGAARQAIGDRTQSFTAILKPSYAPIEQYAETQGLRQGPWTDIYAMAAVMHTLITGHPPPPATARAMSDGYTGLQAAGYSAGLLKAVDWALRVAPQSRPHTVAEWREVLDGRAEPPPPPEQRTVFEPRTLPDDRTVVEPRRQPVTTPPPAVAPAPTHFPATQLMADDATVAVPSRTRAEPPAPASTPTPAPAPRAAPASPTPARRGPGLIIAAAIGLAALAGVGWQLTRPKPDAVLEQPAASTAGPEAVPKEAASAAAVPVVAVPLAVAPPSAVASRPEPREEVLPNVKPVPVPARPASAPASKPGGSTPSRPESQRPNRPAGNVDTPVPAPHTTSPRPEPNKPSANLAPEPPPASAANPVTGAAPSPLDACAKRVFLARDWCVDKECRRPIFANHPECVRLRELRDRSGQGAP